MSASSRKQARKAAAARRTQPMDEAGRPLDARVEHALTWLRQHATNATRDGMARYAIPSDHALGVAMRDIQALARQLGRDHALALALWETGVYEARMLTAYVDEPDQVTAAQMDRWCRDFDNWAICDTLCFALWDRTPHAWKKVPQWANKRDEFVKRAGFVLLACLALHDRTDVEGPFLDGLKLIEREATDARNFVKKAVNWALRAIGGKRNPILKAAALDVAERLAASDDATARWIGKDALRQLGKRAARTAAAKKMAAKQAPSGKVPAKQARAAK